MAEITPPMPDEAPTGASVRSRLGSRRTWTLLIAVVLLGLSAWLLAVSRMPQLLPVPAGAVASLDGTGAKTGPPVRLAGNYHLVAQVVEYPGCRYRVGLSGDATYFAMEDGAEPDARVDVLQTATGTLRDREYSLVVDATGCGRWLVWLTGP